VTLVRTDVSPKHQFLQERHSVTSQKLAFFIVTAMKISLYQSTLNMLKTGNLKNMRIFAVVQRKCNILGISML
jgi:hypothetical protein